MRTFTPNPVGEMPPNVKTWDDGPPFGRIALTLDCEPVNGQVVLDHETGEKFRITTGVACGAGCRCAAEAEWVRP